MKQPLSFDEYWPRWPDGVGGESLLDVRLQTRLPELFRVLWTPDSHFLLEANQERRYVNFHCTEWVTRETELPDLPGGFDWSCAPPGSAPDNLVGKLRKVRFDTQAGKMFTQPPFKTEEVQRCVAYGNETIVVDACVSTTAPFCENFRVICRYTMRAAGSGLCHLTVAYHVVYLEQINLLIKGMVEKGIREGLKSNFTIFGRVLGRHVPLALEPPLRVPSAEGLDLEGFPTPMREMSHHSRSFLLSEVFVSSAPYSAAINWPALPPVGVLCSFGRASRGASLSARVAVVLGECLLALLYCLLLRGLFDLWLAVRERWPSSIAGLVPGMAFHEALMSILICFVILEGAQIMIYGLKRLMILLRQEAVHLYGVTNDAGRKLQMTLDRSLHVKRGPVPDDATPEQRPAHRDALALQGGGEGLEEPAAPFSQKLVSAFWTLVYYNNSEFRKFLCTIPIEERTNPDGSVVEEIFENERLQPFRGWGHQWPGHFLPTDKFSHWSTFDSDGNIMTCDIRSMIEPKLPTGWEWKEPDWQVDVSQQDISAVDQQGWHYSLDFPWMTFTPKRNCGIKNFSDFVRRRRWIRTRVQKAAPVPEPLSPEEAHQKWAETTPYFSFLQFL